MGFQIGFIVFMPKLTLRCGALALLVACLLLVLPLADGATKKKQKKMKKAKQKEQERKELEKVPQIDEETRKRIEEEMRDRPSIPNAESGKVPYSIFDAVLDNDPTLIKAIMAHGGDLDEIGEGGQTPLIHAVMHDMLDMANWLIKVGADPDITEDNGFAAVHAAAFKGNAQMVKMLINHKHVDISPTEHDDQGLAPIHRAAWGTELGHTEVIEVLLEAGVPWDQKTAQGHTALDILTKSGNRASAELLLQWASKELADKKKKEL